jgi:hypothetical protein
MGDTAATVQSCKQLCRLWAGFGVVNEIKTGTSQTFVVKKVILPSDCTSIGDERKKQSYECEAHFYENGMASRLHEIGCCVPLPIYVQSGGSVTIAMTKLDGTSTSAIDFNRAAACMTWFARLHSEFWGSERADAAVAKGIQKQGTYWYLDTRPDEFSNMPNHGWEGRLKLTTAKIDAFLKSDECFQTICHGDAKSANMLFKSLSSVEEDEWTVQMYDFQYCGKACFGKDLAYFFICALSDANDEEALMQIYHDQLERELAKKWSEKCPELEELRAVVDICVCDLGRWMSGWGFWGHDVSERIVSVLDRRSF